MKPTKTVRIPIELFNEIASFIAYLKFSSIRVPNMYDIDSMFSGIMEKQHSINLRKSYSNVVRAKDDEQWHVAIEVYKSMQEKRC